MSMPMVCISKKSRVFKLGAMDCGWDVWGKPVPLDKIVEERSIYNNVDEFGKRAKIKIENNEYDGR